VRDVYDDVIAPRSRVALATRLATDKDVQENLKTAVDELRNAADRMQGRGQSHTGRNIALIVTGIVIGVLFNPVTGGETRRWVRERVLGGGDKFDYSSPSTTGNGSTGG
jgi:hypothetical protein